MAIEIEFVLRLSAAVVAGMLIGLNRDLENKPIGMRTLALVALGSATVTLATVYFADLAAHPDALSRVVQGIIQGVLTGVGFIGAGVVLRDLQSKTVHGLTTAATVWVTAAIGIACGLGSWVMAVATLALTIFVLVGLKKIERALDIDHQKPKERQNDQP